MAQIESVQLALQNEPHKPRGTVHPYDCLNILAELLNIRQSIVPLEDQIIW